MRRLLVLLLLFSFLAGCAQNNQANPQAGGNAAAGGENGGSGGDVLAPEIYFWPLGTLPDATIGVPYTYSFCDPEPTNVNDLCGALQDSTSPSNGHFPYHFTLDSGTGFPPMGIILNPNGLMSGTPTTAGTSVFGVCAVDLDGLQKCANISLTVKKPIELTVHITGSGHGRVMVLGGVQNVTCDKDCVVPFAGAFSSAALPFLPDAGSAFGGWSGECIGNRPCQPIMDSDKEVTAEFDKFDVKVTSATCTYSPSGGYDFNIRVSATASGPKGSYLSMDMAHYNGFLDMAVDCGSWGEQGNGAYCVSKGAGTTQWSTSFRMGSPRDDGIIHPFDWNPSMILTIGYGSDNTFYSFPGVEDPKSQQIIVPMKIHCD